MRYHNAHTFIFSAVINWIVHINQASYDFAAEPVVAAVSFSCVWFYHLKDGEFYGRRISSDSESE